MWYSELFKELEMFKDEERAQEMSRYMRNQFSFIGVGRPDRTLLEKKYFKNLDNRIDWEFVEECFKRDEREYQYLAIDYLQRQKKYLYQGELTRIKTLIETRSWWDSVDGFPKILGDIVLRDEAAKETMLLWSSDENTWVRRAAILHQLLMKERTDRMLLEAILEANLGSKEFFINKAIGWILRDFSKTDREWVSDFIAAHDEKMSSLSIREASKYL